MEFIPAAPLWIIAVTVSLVDHFRCWKEQKHRDAVMIQSADFAEVCDGALGEEIHTPPKSVHLDNTDNGFLGTFLVI